MAEWNPWHGCKKVSPGCRHCYVYRRDAEFGKDSSVVTKTASFGLPVKKNRRGEYKLKPEDGVVYTCFTSDFFVPEADEWRPEAWRMIRERSDLSFFFITKRPERFCVGLPEDWGEGYSNVTVGCTCEDQKRADTRLPVFLELPIANRVIIHEPMLEAIDISEYLRKYTGTIARVSCGGESGEDARICDYGWVLNTMTQCVRYGVPFEFRQTGANFKKGNRIYHIERNEQQRQAKLAGIDFPPVNNTE